MEKVVNLARIARIIVGEILTQLGTPHSNGASRRQLCMVSPDLQISRSPPGFVMRAFKSTRKCPGTTALHDQFPLFESHLLECELVFGRGLVSRENGQYENSTLLVPAGRQTDLNVPKSFPIWVGCPLICATQSGSQLSMKLKKTRPVVDTWSVRWSPSYA